MAQSDKSQVFVLPAQPGLTAVRPAGRARWGRHTRRVVGHIVAYMVMTAMCIVFLIPLFWMISTSFKDRGQVFLWPPRWIPDPIVWQNFPEVFRLVPFGRFIINTMNIMLWNILGNIISTLLVAYGFARLRFPGRDIFFMLLIATMMIPYQVTLIPTFIMFKLIGWYNTYLPLTVPAFFGAPFFIFLMRQYMMTLPLELDDAARIDGCNYLQVLYRILTPLCIPPLTIVVVFTFIGVWNDYFGPLIYLNDAPKFTVALGMVMFEATFYGTVNYGLLMAAGLMSVIPLLVLYYFAQDKLIGGIASVGLKG
ncbi:MAG: carbohydrate ABC transporter permease [Anaerolineae bacterium]|nr:carbohydrate ABC transporter permease [Anaerolineae bacterium]